ncbi:SAM-dependent methyltransferase [Cellulomonas dongxiuzhuiae]|uniref:site-specific DNA-methyltransferase (adenine-specific) n=1 Tax=Cellulomonas dongxiuzhuiae TaxID=2819979 RepID=A0ABX8GIY0_9CELL|nr:N-6 DNA methylase [Cellulomonas dongxiuzhuiae]QWC15827.1 SAM-dependent methyltransferase [Cellulomonas dongxiuzhuiae]
MSFDSAAIDHLISQYGLRKTWLSILATALGDREDLTYILESREFSDAEVLKSDLIAGLTIGEISVLYEYSHAMADHRSRKSNGQFFTPDDVAKFMARFATRFPSGRWLDPCSGIGNLTWHLVAQQENPEEFLRHRMVLSDVDDLALLIARTLLTSAFQDQCPNLFHEIRDNFVQFDFLSVPTVDSSAAPNEPSSLIGIPEHDYVIVNPPYLAIKSKDMRFETARSADLYAYFLENIIKTSKGFISVTPQSFTNAAKFQDLRALLLRSFESLEILTFDNIPGNVFRGIKFGSKNSNTANSIRAAITVALPGGGKRRITSLMRWRTAERTRLFEEVEMFLSEAPLTPAFFPKVSGVFLELYKRLDGSPRLASLCQKTRTSYPLYVPSAPRYFIPALKSSVKRASQRVLYFKTDEERDRAYLLINSSLMYWWWRVRDGGMTLSQETLLSLPIPDFKVDDSLVGLLEESERVNKVYKMNAGAAQENVKHPLALVAQINRLIVPDYADRLLLTHENTEFAQARFLPGEKGCRSDHVDR